MKVIKRIPSNIFAITLLVFSFFYPLCTVYSSSRQPETYVARTSQAADETQMNLRLLSALQSEETISQNPTDSFASSITRARKPKDPAKALAFAVLPGIILHGSGHFYTERYGTAAILFGSELLGLVLELGSAMEDMRDGGGSDNLTLGAWSVVLFFGSWTYDMVAAPLAVKKYNKTLLENKNMGIQLHFKAKKPILVLERRF